MEQESRIKKELDPRVMEQYWARVVPGLLSPRADCDCLNITFDEAGIQSLLLDPLEHFLASCLPSSHPEPCPSSSSSSSDVPFNLDNVKQFLEAPSSLEPLASGQEPGSILCGRMFKPGEATYCCRDCSTDPTCVLCVDCFKASIHKGHKYRMSMSGGGGYCDCGDPEAWKSDDYGCASHKASRTPSSVEESPPPPPNEAQTMATPGQEAVKETLSELESRLESVVRAVIRYCHLTLTWESPMNLPEQLDPNSTQDEEEKEASSSGTSKESFTRNLSILKCRSPPRKFNVSRGKGIREVENPIYATMLFNDEIHTYEQVIATLGRAIECSQKEAIDFATTIDREGRSIVKCSASFQTCSSVKATIERITGRNQAKPLKTEVMLTSVIAHQNFAARCLSWIQDRLLPCAPILFRRVFGKIMSEPFDTVPEGRTITAPPSLLEQVMRSDVKLWKTARNQWHQLFVSGLLMDPNSKRYFARTFTRLYPTLSKDFVSDDHDVNVSIMSLTVQIYTVPSLGLDLLTGSGMCPGALYILLKTFIDECNKFLNPSTGKLLFERVVTTIVAFRRAQYILVDLKYLLANCKPRGMDGSNFPQLESGFREPSAVLKLSADGTFTLGGSNIVIEEDKLGWTSDLRQSFVHGFEILTQLLDWMQGMDSVVRQVGAHVEFESEWENGINLQLKLTPVISLLIEWATSDQVVLLKCLRHCLRKLNETWSSDSGSNPIVGSPITCRLLDTSVDDVIEYDVSSNHVSVHAPLSRVTVALLVQLSAKCGIEYNSPRFLIRNKPSLVQLMEPSLRTLVLAAQFRAGMWRRNGYSLVNQVYFYHNARLREEMFDRDILALQYVASNLAPDEFLIHIIYKFGLVHVVKAFNPAEGKKKEVSLAREAEDITRQNVTILEEFLSLILTLVSERWSPGLASNVSAEERIKKEIIQCLAIEPMSHSELLKSLPKDAAQWPNIENVIESVARFKRPAPDQTGTSGATSGKYEVKEDLIEDWFNPFFYHYSREQSGKAEAAQLKRKKVQAKMDGWKNPLTYICCPPPLPPKFSDSFRKVLDVLTCDTTLHVIRGVLDRATSAHSHSVIFSEVQFEKVVQLIALGLREEERFVKNLISENPDVPVDTIDDPSGSGGNMFDFSRKCLSKGIYDLLKQVRDVQKSDTSTCVHMLTSEHVLELLRWTIDKFKCDLVLRGLEPDGDQAAANQDVPITSSGSSDQKSRSSSEAAAKRRERIMAQIRNQQKSFMSQNPAYFAAQAAQSVATGQEASSQEESATQNVTHPIALGAKQRGRKVYEKEVHTCILCREEQEVNAHSSRSLVLCALIQRSTVLSKNRSSSTSVSSSPVSTTSADTPTAPIPVMHAENQSAGSQSSSVEALFMPSDLNIGAHVSTCGHVMHADCWQKFFESVLAKERRRPLRYGRHVSFDVDKAEYLCPLCECLSNTVIPILPPPSELMLSSSKRFIQEEMSMSDWIKALFASVDQSEPIWVKDPSMSSE